MATATIVHENIAQSNHLHDALPNTIINVNLNYFGLRVKYVNIQCVCLAKRRRFCIDIKICCGGSVCSSIVFDIGDGEG